MWVTSSLGKKGVGILEGEQEGGKGEPAGDEEVNKGVKSSCTFYWVSLNSYGVS